VQGTTPPDSQSTALRPVSLVRDTAFTARCETGSGELWGLVSLHGGREAGMGRMECMVEYRDRATCK